MKKLLLVLALFLGLPTLASAQPWVLNYLNKSAPATTQGLISSGIRAGKSPAGVTAAAKSRAAFDRPVTPRHNAGL